MFDLLTDKLTAVFHRISDRGHLTEEDVDKALREVRLALLEADVNFRVAGELIERIKQQALGEKVLGSVSPGQQVVKIVLQELTDLLGHGHHDLRPSSKGPSVLLLLGLQGSGKTTTAAKLALHLRNKSQGALLVGTDLRRPAAVEQLNALGKQMDIPVFPDGETFLHTSQTTPSTVEVAQQGVERARDLGLSWAIVDTGGRLHIDDELMVELEEIKSAVSPAESILVVDAMTGQDAVTAAQEFHQRIGLTGLILSKLDGDARGGAALSIAHVTGVPVKFIGTGEKPNALEQFHPDRLASRVLGMGDILTLIERAEEQVGEKQAKEVERKIRRDTFGLDDFLEQLHQLRRMGPLSQVLEMVPGLSSIARKLPVEATDESKIKKVEAIIYSMTVRERRSPNILNGSRRRRIASGSGTTTQDVNQLLNQFERMRKMMKKMSSGRGLKGVAGLFQ